jgi:hypothetical protein
LNEVWIFLFLPFFFSNRLTTISIFEPHWTKLINGLSNLRKLHVG